MRHHLFLKAETPQAVHDAFAAVREHCASYEGVELHNGWWALRARLLHEDAPDELESRGWVVWDHIVDYTATLEDRHHVGIVPSEAGIETGDTPLVAARKLYVHLGSIRSFRPSVVY